MANRAFPAHDNALRNNRVLLPDDGMVLIAFAHNTLDTLLGSHGDV